MHSGKPQNIKDKKPQKEKMLLTDRVDDFTKVGHHPGQREVGRPHCLGFVGDEQAWS